MSSIRIRTTARVFTFVYALAILVSPVFSQMAATLPDDPQPQSQTTQPTPQSGTGTISGTILDPNGDVIQGASVHLSRVGGASVTREATSNGTGAFVFSGLEPGAYTVTVAGEGMTSFVSKPMDVGPGQVVTVPNVVLSVAGFTTNVTVGDERQVSIEQVQTAEQQRVFAVFPNFYSSFDWNAPPMMTKEKYHLALRTIFDPVTFVTVGAVAGAEQYKNVFPSFGGGIEGYGKRYGTTFANHASSEMFSRAIYPSIFHDDPRYFVMGAGTTRDRAFHAVASTFVTRGDNGHRKVNYSEILGKLTAAALSNAYYPEQERGVHLVVINGLGDIGGNILDNLLREFVFGHLTSRAAHQNP